MLTDLTFLDTGQPWPPTDQDTKDRLQMYHSNRLLFEGKHQEVFKDWVRLLRADHQATLEIILNWHKRLTTLFADLLLGEPPKITVGAEDTQEAEQEQLEDLVERNNLHNRLYEAAMDVSRYGDGPLKIFSQLDPIDNKTKAVIQAQQPAVWFPVVSPTNIKEFLYHVLAWTYKEGKDEILYVEIHTKGSYETRKYKLVNGQIKFLLESTTTTHLAKYDFLVVPIHNLITSDRATGLDDYSDLDTVIQELETRVAQIARILDKHSDPNMYGPDSAMEQTETGEWAVRGGGKFWPVNDGENPPGYVTWNGQLDSAFTEINLLMDQLYTLSETSAAAFGQLKAGLAESGSALKRLLMAPLAKVNRIRMRMDPAVKKALKIAAQLEGTTFDEIKIAWQDGVPIDEKEQADMDTARYTAGIMSLETALQHQGFEGDALEQEMKRIKDGEEAKNPAVPAPAGPKITLPPAPGTEPPKPEPPKE